MHGRAAWPLYVSGPTGAGKTCAGLFACDVIERSIYTTASDLHSRTYGDGHRRAVFFGIEITALFVLDEIGVRTKVSDAAYETIREAADLREHRPAIYLSNVSIDQIGELYDGRVLSRMGCGTIVELQGNDRRFNDDVRSSAEPKGVAHRFRPDVPVE